MTSAEAYVALWERAHSHRAGALIAADPAFAGGRTPDDLSALAGGVAVLGAPSALVLPAAGGDVFQVCGRGSDGYLHAWVRVGTGGWTHTNVTVTLPPGVFAGPGRPNTSFTITSDPAAAVGSDGVVRVFARGPAGQLLVFFAPQAGSGWSVYDDASSGIGVPFVGSPSVALDRNGTLHVAVRATDGRLVEFSQSSLPEDPLVTGHLLSGPNQTSLGPSRSLPVDIHSIRCRTHEPNRWRSGDYDGLHWRRMGVCSDRAYHLIAFSGGPGAWASTDVTATLPPGAFAGPGRPNTSFTITSDPAAAVGSDGVVRVFARGPAGQLLVFFAPQAGSGWSVYDDASSGIGVPFVGSPSVALDRNGTLHVAVRATDGRLVEFSQSFSPRRPARNGPLTVGTEPDVLGTVPLPSPWTFTVFDIGGAEGNPKVVSSSGTLVIVRGVAISRRRSGLHETGYGWEAGQSKQIVFTTGDGHIHELYVNVGGAVESRRLDRPRRCSSGKFGG